MVVLAILSIAAAVAFAGFRQDEYRGQHRRFVQDVRGAVMTARNWAIDEQTQVRVIVDAQTVQVTAFDPQTNVWSQIDRRSIASPRQAQLQATDTVCIYGIQSGVHTPAQAAEEVSPPDCLGATQTMMFEPDGTFSDPTGELTTVDNAGFTFWIGDRQLSGVVKFSLIQVFPGGLIRAIDNLDPEAVS
jgi:Tfp pilus assembly protein FimT